MDQYSLKMILGVIFETSKGDSPGPSTALDISIPEQSATLNTLEIAPRFLGGFLLLGQISGDQYWIGGFSYLPPNISWLP